VELADLFCRQARLRAEAHFAALWDNTDSAGCPFGVLRAQAQEGAGPYFSTRASHDVYLNDLLALLFHSTNYDLEPAENRGSQSRSGPLRPDSVLASR